MGYGGLLSLYTRVNLVTMYAFSQDPNGQIGL